MDNGSPLKTSQKLELLIVVLQHRPLRPILDTFDSGQLVEVHSFIWDKLVELHYLTQDSEFEREIVTRQMVPSAEYQKQQNCDLRLDYCKGVECIWSNPVCAGNKVKNNVEVMAKVISDYIKSRDQKSRGMVTGRLTKGLEVTE